ncbi:MAG TPA: DUF3794 domain-containing protein [Clostridiales bacterium]|nr:DUF3794 domain-containing protein [Clostridiales bacterium]
MELNLQRQTITINETVYQGSVEHPIECDGLLPDYCPDIVKVLKCNAVVHVDSSSVSGDRLTIEGMTVCHVYYTSESNQIRHVEYKIPFSKNVDLRSSPSDPIISVIPSVDYVNCRAVNPRRLDMRGAISFTIKITDQKQVQFISDAIGGNLQFKQEMVKATDVLGQCQSSFPIIEELDLGYGKPPIGNIIRSDCRIRLLDQKVVSGKCVVKGDFLLHILYQPVEENDNLQVMEYTLPISQILDCEAADEDCICDVELMVASCMVSPKVGDDGECRAFSLDAKVLASVTPHRHTEIPVACDCFSTRYESSCKHAPVTFQRLVNVVNEVAMHKVSLDLPEGIDCVLDAWCEVDSLTWKQRGDALQVDCNLTISLFARMESRECLYFEQQSQFSHTIPLGVVCDDISFEPTCDVLSSSYSLVGKEKIDLRCEVMIKGCVYCTIRRQSIASITVDENKQKQKEQNKLYIYYAEPGESVWEIAKRYNTSPAAIWEENGIQEDSLAEKCMLLIPIV